MVLYHLPCNSKLLNVVIPCSEANFGFLREQRILLICVTHKRLHSGIVMYVTNAICTYMQFNNKEYIATYVSQTDLCSTGGHDAYLGIFDFPPFSNWPVL